MFKKFGLVCTMILFLCLDQLLIQSYFNYESVQVGIKTQWLVEYVKLMTEKNNSMNLKLVKV